MPLCCGVKPPVVEAPVEVTAAKKPIEKSLAPTVIEKKPAAPVEKAITPVEKLSKPVLVEDVKIVEKKAEVEAVVQKCISPAADAPAEKEGDSSKTESAIAEPEEEQEESKIPILNVVEEKSRASGTPVEETYLSFEEKRAVFEAPVAPETPAEAETQDEVLVEGNGVPCNFSIDLGAIEQLSYMQGAMAMAATPRAPIDVSRGSLQFRPTSLAAPAIGMNLAGIFGQSRPPLPAPTTSLLTAPVQHAVLRTPSMNLTTGFPPIGTPLMPGFGRTVVQTEGEHSKSKQSSSFNESVVESKTLATPGGDEEVTTLRSKEEVFVDGTEDAFAAEHFVANEEIVQVIDDAVEMVDDGAEADEEEGI
ncbi:unnamed protein product [Amoebophrya sp. A25]|nr:unnamed protein product [Amoebophrya sp. A25]|eukprot:GSA25T00004584001.1